MRRSRLLAVVGVALVTGLVGGCADVRPWQSEMASVNAAGTDSANMDSIAPVAISPDGTKVVFSSEATDLVPGDHPGRNAYLRDLTTGTTAWLAQGDAGSFSPDGSAVLFRTEHSFSPIDTNGVWDWYLYDLASETRMLVSVDSTGAAPGAWLAMPQFSADGNRIAFVSSNGGIFPFHVQVRDLAAGTTTLVSVNTSGAPAARGGNNPRLSPDGTKVAFSSDATDLVPLSDTNNTDDVFIRDLTTGTTTLVTSNAAGTDTANGRSGHVTSFNQDSSKIAFESQASNIRPGDGNAAPDVYVYDLTTGARTLASVNTAGTDLGTWAETPDLSPDGTRVAFTSPASNLGPVDSNNKADIYVRDLVASTTTLVSTRVGGADSGNGTSTCAQFSPDGTQVVFLSAAGDLGPADHNGRADLYLAKPSAGVVLLVDGNAAGTDAGNRGVESCFISSIDLDRSYAMSGDGSRIAYVTQSNDLGPTDSDPGHEPHELNPGRDVYVAHPRP